MPAEIVRMIAVGEGCFAGDASCSNEFCQRLFHRHHAVGTSCLNVGAELVIVAAADQVSRCEVATRISTAG